MIKLFCKTATVLLLLFSSYVTAGAARTYIFINSDIPKHQNTINQLNSIIRKSNSLEDRIFIIDIAEEEKEFRGEITYVHDTTGYYLAEFMPLEIPEVIEVFDDEVVQHYRLDFYGLKLINHLVTESLENEND